jgi:uroporphyrinogen decarboxylase
MQPLQTGQMTSRERVLAAMQGQPVDRVPVMLLLNPHTAVRMSAGDFPGPGFSANLLSRIFWGLFPKDMGGSELARFLPLTMLGYAHSDYPLHLGADVAIPVSGLPDDVRDFKIQKGKVTVRDLFGATRGVGQVYADVIDPPIKSVADLKTYRFPDTKDPRRYDGIRAYRKAHPEACLLTESFGVQDLPASQLWTMDGMMMAYYDYPDEVHAFQQRMEEWAIEHAVNGIRAGADVAIIYDDYGANGRPMISMKMWEAFTLPHLRRIVAAIHEAGGLVMLHSCGYQMPFLKYYTEIGLDALQTFQPKAGNDLEKAVAEYGDRLTFVTGIDIQLGEMMTPEQLRTDILCRYKIGKAKNRLILGTTHEMQYTMPRENIRIILETVREIQNGAHG